MQSCCRAAAAAEAVRVAAEALHSAPTACRNTDVCAVLCRRAAAAPEAARVAAEALPIAPTAR
jgi:hypothetical protein